MTYPQVISCSVVNTSPTAPYPQPPPSGTPSIVLTGALTTVRLEYAAPSNLYPVCVSLPASAPAGSIVMVWFPYVTPGSFLVYPAAGDTAQNSPNALGESGSGSSVVFIKGVLAANDWAVIAL